ncbi:MAG TPA: OsmC family protein [Bacteroidales bacterium]|nr:OsmC family protein [Bacteroidales bacterium]
MKHEVNTKWLGNMKFDSLVDEHHVVIDSLPESGGENSGPRPKQLMLTALAGCTAMDVVSILKKMKITPDEFQVKINAHLTDEHPKHYDALHLIYEFKGKDLPLEKIEQAISLSQEKYCGVSFMYKKIMNLTYEIVIL